MYNVGNDNDDCLYKSYDYDDDDNGDADDDDDDDRKESIVIFDDR